MFFYLSKIVTFLIDPLFIILLLLAVFLVRGTRRIRTRLIFLSLYFVLYLVSTGFVANALLVKLERLVPPSPPVARYDAVIVLSGMTGIQNHNDDRIEFSGAVDRILAGIRMIREGRSDRLIISGGDGSLKQINRPEAEMLRSFAIRWGLDPKQILIDSESRNTYENAVRTAELLSEHPADRLLLITSAFHMFRSRGCFRQAGLAVDVYPVDFMGEEKVADFRGFLPSSISLARTNRVVHELVGIVVYWLSGRADYSFFKG